MNMHSWPTDLRVPDATVGLNGDNNTQKTYSLADVVEGAIRRNIRKNPEELLQALFEKHCGQCQTDDDCSDDDLYDKDKLVAK